MRVRHGSGDDQNRGYIQAHGDSHEEGSGRSALKIASIPVRVNSSARAGVPEVEACEVISGAESSRLTRYLTVFALPLTFSLAFASPALADDEFCIALDKTVLENIDPALLGENAHIRVTGVPAEGDAGNSQVITPENTAACFKIYIGLPWIIMVNNKAGDKFVLGLHNPVVGKLDVLLLNTEVFFGADSFDGDFKGGTGFPGLQFGNLSVASVVTGDDGVYRVIMTGSLIEEVEEVEETRKP